MNRIVGMKAFNHVTAKDLRKLCPEAAKGEWIVSKGERAATTHA